MGTVTDGNLPQALAPNDTFITPDVLQHQGRIMPEVVPGSIVEVAAGNSGSIEQARVLDVNHVREKYTVQFCNGAIKVIWARSARLIR